MILLPVLLCLLSAGAPDAVFLDHSAEITALPDSGYIEYTREVIVPLTGRGVERYRILSITHREGWESIEILNARTGHWRAGRGSCAAEITEIPHRALLHDGRLETTLRETIVSFQGLERGDTLILEVARRIDRLPIADFYSYSYYSGGRDSVAAGSFTVIWPLNRTLHVSESTEFSSVYRETSEDGTVRRTWTSGPVTSSPMHYLAPGIRETAPGIIIAGSMPEDVSEGFRLVIDVEPCSEEALNVADSVLAVSGNDPEGVRRWVASEIDYIGADWGEYPGFTPRSPLETLSCRSGVCRDNALLLVWLLRRAGWQADLLLTSSGGIAADLVGSRSFDHMLARVVTDDGYLFLDPTAALSRNGLDSGYRGLRYLALTDPGSGIEVFPDPGTGDTLRITVTGTLDTSAGTVTGGIELRLSGSVEDLFRTMLRQTVPERRRELLDVLTGVRPGSGDWTIPDLYDTSVPLVLDADCQWDVAVLQVPGGTAVSLPGLLEMSLLGTGTAARLLPEEISHHGIRLITPAHEILTVRLSGFSGTPDVPLQDSAGCWNRRITLDAPDTLLILEECVLEPVRPDSIVTLRILRGLAARCCEQGRTVVFR